MNWIPVKYRKLTDKERQEGIFSEDVEYCIESELPDEDQEILVTIQYEDRKTGLTKYYVDKDVCLYDGCKYLDSGLDWVDDVVAWMPLPKPYEPQERSKE